MRWENVSNWGGSELSIRARYSMFRFYIDPLRVSECLATDFQGFGPGEGPEISSARVWR